MRRALALLTRKPQPIWLEFLSRFTQYTVFIVVDDSGNYDELKLKYPMLRFIQIDTTECKLLGYTYVCYSPPDRKPVVAWEKALFYFTRNNQTYDQVWFIEDDIFFYDEQTLLDIDAKYEMSGLLTSPYEEHKTAPKNVWAWGKMDFKVPLPYYVAMVCACRVSKELLTEVKQYVQKNKTLVLHETIFATLAKKKEIQYDLPEELVSVVYRRNWTLADMTKAKVYHPVKDLNLHIEYRQSLSQNLT